MDKTETLIFQQAKVRFSRFGYKKTTMDDISRDCRISKKTLYLYCKNKESLFARLLLHESRKAQTYISSRIELFSDPADRLMNFMQLAVEIFNQDNFITRVLNDKEAINSSSTIKKYHCLLEKALMSSIAKIIEQGKMTEKFRDVDSKMAAYTCCKMLQSFSHMQMSDYSKNCHGYPADVLIDYTLHGIIGRFATK